jgi:TusA-related sulfurtransferase
MSDQNHKKSDIIADDSLDAIGLYCPVPLYQAKKKIDALKVGQILEIIADDPSAEPDFKGWTKTTGHELIKIIKADEKLYIYVRKTEKK